MHFKAALVLFGATAGAVVAAPAIGGFDPQVAFITPPNDQPVGPQAACSTVWSIFGRASQAQPDEVYLQGFIVSQDRGATNKNDMLVEFAVPPGSFGCQLEAFFPAGAAVKSSGQTQVYVYSTEDHLLVTPRGVAVSWNRSPAAFSQVGSVMFQSSNSQNTTTYINSFTCQPKLTYRLSITKDSTDAGAVAFDPSQGGLRMKYNC